VRKAGQKAGKMGEKGGTEKDRAVAKQTLYTGYGIQTR